MPFGQDILTRIINVNWGGGGVFIAGDIDSNIYRLNTEDEKPAWQKLGKLDFHKEDKNGFFSGRVAGSAYAVVDNKDSEGNVIGRKPVFVLVGGSGFANEFGIIMASKDGLNWSRVFSFGPDVDSDTYTGAGIFGVVWDGAARQFYAGGHQVDNFADAATEQFWEEQTDLLFQSSDGYSWSEVGRHVMHVEWHGGDEKPPYAGYKTGLLVEHCSKLVKDSNGNGVPDGNYGYKSETLLIAPSEVIKIDYLFGLYLNDIPTGSNVTVTNFGEGSPPSYPSDVDIPITCTATAGGKWMAAGGVLANFDEGKGSSQAAILVPSEGDGYEWKALNPVGTNMIITMIGGTTNTNAGL